jgi:two-component system OmpR family sensor kinase
VTAARRQSGAPLFLRIFATMLAAVACVQLISIILVMLLPPPAPRVFSVLHVAEALTRNSDPSGELMLSDEPPPAAAEPEYPRSLRLRHILAARLGVGADRVQVHHGPIPHFPLLGSPPRSARHGRRAFWSDAGEELLFGDFTASVRLADGRWRTARPAHSDFGFWRWRALLWLVVALLAVTPLAWRLARPIAQFASAAERLGRHPGAPPVAIAGPPELAEAAAAFNEMQARLTRYVEDRALLIAAIAHDLRTPLMRLSLRLEGAAEPLAGNAAADIAEMEAMIAAVLAFLRDLSTPARRQKLDLRALAESVTDGFVDHGDKVRLEPGDPVVVEGDAAAFKTLIANLVGNATAYGGGADVRLGEDGKQAWLEVADEGPGIPEESIERVFQPFFRLEPSRNRETGGMGLGLASARAVARGHGGDILLANREGGGLVARVTLPI